MTLLNGAIPGLFFFIFVPVLIQLIVKKLPLTGSEQEITDVWSDHSSNCATTTTPTKTC